ncbi:hypothetical protein ACS0TY_010412 [Phlomoides rotata]
MDHMDSENCSLSILMFPWLAHGHIFPYLELAKRISKKKNFHIHVCSTAINLSSINQFIHKNSLAESMQVVELHLEPSPQLPPHYHTTKNLPSNLKRTLLEAFQTAKSSFSNIIATLKPNLIIYDIFQPWVPDLASQLSVPAVHFTPFGAAVMSYVHHHYVTWKHDFPFPELRLQDHVKKSVDEFIEFARARFYNQDKGMIFVNFNKSSEIALMKTSRGLEGKYIDYFSSIPNSRIIPVGPLVTSVDDKDDHIHDEDTEILQWLSKKGQYSTVYISFGSEFFLSKEEIGEIAKGLELSGVNFIWGLRSPPGEKPNFAEEAIPGGFLERAGDRGRMVFGWTPQAKILAHGSTGAFLSHGGWSSINESMYYGVPMIVMPVILDAYVNAGMLGDAGAGVEVPRTGEAVAEAINKVVVEKSCAEGFRVRVGELSEKMRMEEEEEMNVAAEELWQIASKNKAI